MIEDLKTVRDALESAISALKHGVNVPEENVGSIKSVIDEAEKALLITPQSTNLLPKLEKVRDALADCEHEVNCNKIDMQEGGGYYFNNEAKCNCERNKILATLDRIIADHIPDAREMVVPDGYALVPKKILESLHQKPVYGNYDYQCGYLDCLKDAKAMLSAAPQPPKNGD